MGNMIKKRGGGLLYTIKNEYNYLTGETNSWFPDGIIRYARDRKFRVNILLNWYQNEPVNLIKKRIRRQLELKYMVVVGVKSKYGEHAYINDHTNIVIGDGVVAGSYLTIYPRVTLGQKNGKFPALGDHVTIFSDAVVLGDIKIGDSVSIGEGAVVFCNVPTGKKADGVPAMVR